MNFDLRFVVDEQHSRLVRHGLHAVYRLAHDLTQLNGAERKRLTTALGALQVENVIDQGSHEAFGVTGAQCATGSLPFSLITPSMPEESNPSAPRIEVKERDAVRD